MPGQVDVKGLTQGRDLKKGGDAAAARHVGLLHIDRLRFQHSADIVDGVGIFAGRDIHAGRSPLPDRRKAVQIIGRYRLLEPADVLLRERIGEGQRLLDR